MPNAPARPKRPRKPSTKRLALAFQHSIEGCATDEDLAIIQASEEAAKPKEPTRRQLNQMVSLADLRTREPFDRQRTWLADAIIFCPLPYRKTSASHVVRTTRMSATESLVVTYSSADEQTPIAYGEDAFLLDLIASEARKRKTPEVTFESLAEILDAMGIQTDGGEDFKRLRQRLRRIGSLIIRIERPGSIARNVPVVDVDHSVSLDPEREAAGERPLYPWVFRLSPQFYDDLMRHYTVIPLEILRAFNGSPVEYSFARWLYRRVVNAKKPTLIYWDEIKEERGSEDTHMRRFKMKVRAVVKKLKQAWPELAASIEDTPKGLRVKCSAASLIPNRTTLSLEDSSVELEA